MSFFAPEQALRCPRCARPLEERPPEGLGRCARCRGTFTAWALPGAFRAVAVEPWTEGSARCALHDGNRATADCQRCGRFACALCAVDFGDGATCAACFLPAHAEGAIPALRLRRRDAAGSALREAMAAGIFCCGPIAAIAAVHGWQGLQQERALGRSTADGKLAIGLGGGLALLWLGIVLVSLLRSGP